MFGLKIRWAQVALFGWVTFLIGLVLLADSGRGRRLFDLVQAVPAGDKLGHFVLFGILSFLVNLLFRAAEIRLGRISVLKGSAIIAVIVTLEECSQLFFRWRTFDLVDLAADIAGIWLFSRLARHYLQWKKLKLQPAPARRRNPFYKQTSGS